VRLPASIFLVALGFFFEAAVAGFLNLRGLEPDLLLAIVCSLAILQGAGHGALYGLLSGLALDALFGHMGFYSASYFFAAFLCGYFARTMRFDQWVLPGLAFLLAALLKEFYALAYLFFMDVAFAWGAALLKALIHCLFSACAFLGLHFLLSKLYGGDLFARGRRGRL
jgi:rod shape-determining protein MreD